MTCFSILPRTEAPSTLFVSVHLCTPSLVDLERTLEAIVLSRTYSKLLDLAQFQFQQRILKCSNFRKYSFEQGGMSSTLNQCTGTNIYRVTTYDGDKKNARGSKSSGLALKRHNSTLRHTSCTCCAKFTLRMDHNSFFLVCGFGENQHTGHPPLLSNEIRYRKRFLDLSTLGNCCCHDCCQHPSCPSCSVYQNPYRSDLYLWSDGICARIYKNGKRLDGFPHC